MREEEYGMKQQRSGWFTYTFVVYQGSFAYYLVLYEAFSQKKSRSFAALTIFCVSDDAREIILDRI
jgi:type IV secretory pathway TrbL component